MLSQAIAVINGKGGTGKTSLAANLAGLIAAAEYRVLAVDMDPQGNLGRDLGYLAGGQSDRGRAMFGAVTQGAPLQPLADVRSGLDVICGGEALDDLTGTLFARGIRGEESVSAVKDQLLPLADNYDLIFLDCPPGNRHLQHMALATAKYVLIPTRADEASLDGLVKVADLFGTVRERDNPDLELLGVALFAIGSRSKRIAQLTRTTVAKDLGDESLVFEAAVRHVEGPAQDARRRGQLVHELEVDASHATRQRLEWLRSGRGKHRAQAPEESRVSSSTPGLAQDYQDLAMELTARISERAGVPA